MCETGCALHSEAASSEDKTWISSKTGPAATSYALYHGCRKLVSKSLKEVETQLHIHR